MIRLDNKASMAFVKHIMQPQGRKGGGCSLRTEEGPEQGVFKSLTHFRQHSTCSKGLDPTGLSNILENWNWKTQPGPP